MDQEILRAILYPFQRVIGLEITLFMAMMFPLIWLYVKVKSIALPLMLFLVITGSFTLGSLYQGMPYPMVPDLFDEWVFMFTTGALMWIFYAAWRKK